MEGLWEEVEDLTMKGAELYRQLMLAKGETEIKKAQYDAQVSIEQERTKNMFYLAAGVVIILLIMRGRKSA